MFVDGNDDHDDDPFFGDVTLSKSSDFPFRIKPIVGVRFTSSTHIIPGDGCGE